MNTPGRSIRSHLALLVLATALPLAGLVGYGVYAQAAFEAEQAAQRALRNAQLAVTGAERTLQRARDLMAYLSQQALVNALDPDRCDPVFGAFNGLFPEYTNLLTVRRDGLRICSAVAPPPSAPARVDPALYLAETLRTGAFTVGHINRGLFTGRWILIVAHPLAEVAGQSPGVVAMAIDLGRLRLAPPAASLPPGAEARIIDARGTVLAHSSLSDDEMGRSLGDSPMFKLLQPGKIASGRVRDADGIERFFAAVPVAGTNWHATVGIPVDVVYAPARARALVSAGVALLALLLVGTLAYLIARGTARPVEAIAAAARKATHGPALSAGSLAVPDLATAPTEVRQLADDFAGMLEARSVAEQALRQSEERYRMIVETAQEGIWQIDAESVIVYANAKMAQILGTTVDRMIGAPIFDFMDEAAQATARAVVARRRSGMADQHEFRYRRADGSPVWTQVNGNPLHDPAGNYLGALAMVTDITERRSTQLALAETEAQLHAADRMLADIVHGMNEACYALDSQWRFTFVNDRVEGLMLKRPADMLNRPLWEVFPHIVGTSIEDHYRRAMAQRQPQAFEVFSPFLKRWLDVRLFPSGDGLAAFLLDIHPRKLAELALRSSEERLQAVIDNLAEGLIICEPDGQQVKLNQAARVAYGLAEGVLPGADEFRLAYEMFTLQGQSVPAEDWPLRRLLRGEKVSGLELRMRRLDGGWERVFSYGGALLRDAAGRDLAFLTLTDITQRKRAEQQVLELNQALEQRVQERTAQLAAKSKELESFCYSVSHDLKAPLRGIDGYSRLLMEDHHDRLGEEGRQFIVNVRTATQQMTELIEDLLAYSRQERRSLVAAQIDLRRFVGEQIARQRLGADGVELVVDVDELTVAADPESLAVVLRNLLDNARKFSAQARQATITVRGRAVEGRAVLSVQDNGSGFDMRYHDKIFEIFQRLHRAEDYPGTGVGLALVRKAMDRIGGRVWANSAPGAGATFFLEIPLAHALAEVATPTAMTHHG